VHAVREIRRVLEDDKDNPRFVQTVPREGYRFVGAVSFDEPDQAGADSPPTPAGAGEEQTPPALETQRLPFPPLLKKAAVILIALGSIWGIWHFRRSRTTTTVEVKPGTIRQLWKTSIDGGEITSLLTGVGHYLGPGVSRDGKDLIFYHVMDSKNLMAASVVNSSEPEPVTHDQFHGRPRLSPSGTRVASLMGRPEVKEHLYVTDLQTKQQTPLGEQTASHHCWLDDDTLAYLLSVQSESSTDVVVIDLATLRSFLLTRFAGRAESLAVHPDRKRVAVVLRPADGKQRIVLRNLSGDESEDQVLAEGAEYEYLRWRPDGTLSWSGPRVGSQSNGIWVFERNKPSQLVKDGYGPVWNANSSVVYYARTGEQAGLWKAEARRQWQPELVRRWKGQVDFDLAGDRLVFIVEDDYYHVYSTSLTP